MSYSEVKKTANRVLAEHDLPVVKNFAQEFADGVLVEKFYNAVFNDNNASGIEATNVVSERVKNWEKLNGEIFVGDLANRVFLDADSIKLLAKGQNDAIILKLLAVLLGIQGGTADGYATQGEQIELGDIDDQVLLQQPVTWNVRTEVMTASDTSDEERITGVSREKVFQAKSRKSVVQERHIEQAPLIEEYESEEVVNQVRRVSKPKKTKKIVYEEESSEEEVVVRRPTKRTKKQVEYVEETVSESAEEIVQIRKPVVKQRITKVEPKVQTVIVEEPQVRVTKSAKETIKIPVKAIKQEVISEEVNIETQADRTLKISLQRDFDKKTLDLKRQQRELELHMQELDRQRNLVARLELQYSQKSDSIQKSSGDLNQLQIRLAQALNMATTEMRDRIVEREVTEFVEKKVRKQTTETPYAINNWIDKTRSLSGSRSVRHYSPQNTSYNTSANRYLTTQASPVVRKSMSPSPKRSIKKVRSSAISSGKANYVDLGSEVRSSVTLKGRSLEQHYRKEELAIAKPELDAARQAIWNLDKASLAEIKSYNNPPTKVIETVNAVMILLGQEATWTNAKRLMADPNFKEKLRFVNPENIPIKITKELTKDYLRKPDFTPQAVSVVSVAASVLCLWVRAIVTYSAILHDVQLKVDGKVASTSVVTYKKI